MMFCWSSFWWQNDMLIMFYTSTGYSCWLVALEEVWAECYLSRAHGQVFYCSWTPCVWNCCSCAQSGSWQAATPGNDLDYYVKWGTILRWTSWRWTQKSICSIDLYLPPEVFSFIISQGYGTLLMEEAERIALREHRSRKMAVISGVGTRHYYRKLGYELEGPYMVKYLEWPDNRIQRNSLRALAQIL